LVLRFRSGIESPKHLPGDGRESVMPAKTRQSPADDLTQMSKRLALQGYGLPESRHEPIAI
jgi:hypothetical protein